MHIIMDDVAQVLQPEPAVMTGIMQNQVITIIIVQTDEEEVLQPLLFQAEAQNQLRLQTLAEHQQDEEGIVTIVLPKQDR